MSRISHNKEAAEMQHYMGVIEREDVQKNRTGLCDQPGASLGDLVEVLD